MLLLVGLWVNRGYPGLSVAFVGIFLNGLVITVNGGHMPIWATSLTAAGLTPTDVTSALHVIVPGEASDFFLRALVLGDIIPIPIPFVQNVASLGDLFLTPGLAFFLFASVVRVPTKLEEHEEATVHARLAGLAGAARLPRPDAGRRAPAGNRPRAGPPGSVGSPTTAGPRRAGGGARLPGPGAAPQRLRGRRPRERRRGRRDDHAPVPVTGGARAGPPAPLRPARAQRLVHRPVDRAN